jgi:imidazolonepropionase-like amidohydrolase
MGYHRELEHAIESLKKIHKRGIRILPGGDYGFAWCKHGTNARDLEYFVKHLGFSSTEALVSATSYGGQLMMKPHELGQIQPGFLADMLLVDGDPLADISVLQDQARILAVMKDGVFYKEPRLQSERAPKW